MTDALEAQNRAPLRSHSTVKNLTANPQRDPVPGLHNVNSQTFRYPVRGGLNDLAASLVALALALAACTKTPEPMAPDAAWNSSLDASIATIDAGPPVPAELTWRLIVDQRDGGQALVEPGPEVVSLEPATTLTVRLAPRVKDMRIRLFDGADKVVASDDRAMPLDGGLDYEIVPLTPLGPGLDFVLMVDAETGVELRDDRQTYRDLEVRLRTTGTKEPTPPEPGRKKPKKRR